jgi:outer membrane protein OmpA-like peptidoglycan-associated protein
MKRNGQGLVVWLAAALLLTFGAPVVSAQDTSQKQAVAASDSARGEKMKIKGIIVEREEFGVVVRDLRGREHWVNINGGTSVRSEGNMFNPGDYYDPSVLLRGLIVEVEGRMTADGSLVAKKVRFEKHDLEVARSIDARVTPAEGRLTRVEAEARALAGEVDELNEVSKATRVDVDSNTRNIAAVDQRVTETNDRIQTLDEFTVTHQATVLFMPNSAVLTTEAKAALDAAAQAALSTKGYVIEVAGFTDSTGSVSHNRLLSRRRAEAVAQYMAENYAIPLRRMTMPFGYGEAMPTADNGSREGRSQNRRVDVRIMTSNGITQTEAVTARE